MTMTVSPKSTGVISLKDTGIAKYVEFPKDTFFMESLAQNQTYKKGVAFVPAQRKVDGKREEVHIYTITADSTEAEHFMGPIQVKEADGSTTAKVSVFGSALASDGILWLSAFNRNSIIAVNCETPENPLAFCEIPDLYSPNDLCLDPDDESVLYVAGGTLRNICCCYQFSNSAYGQVFKVQLNADKTNASVSMQAEGMRTLAGVEKIGQTLWLAELYQMQTQSLTESSDASKLDVVWEGGDANDEVWMADNVDTFGPNGEWMLCPAYSTQPKSVVDGIMKRAFLTSLALFYYQVSTACMKGESFSEAILDPEVSLSFSNTYIEEGVPPAPVRLILMKPDDSKQSFHFEVDLEETRANHQPYDVKAETGEVKQRHFFNEQVTHAGWIPDAPDATTGYIACVNFEQTRILLLKDTPFVEAMEGEA